MGDQGLIIDNFAGGGGASTGIERALGRSIDIAINHDPQALSMHAANHPRTKHLCESVWTVDIAAVVAGRPVALCWFSPDCKHFSKAKGGKPVEKHIRGLAWVALKWAGIAKPRVLILENVEEFQTWGPLVDGQPCKRRKGMTFKRWVTQLRNLGYVVDWRELRACDYGAPTIRKRLFIIARRDGEPITWPEQTHASEGDMFYEPYRTAADCIDWDLPCASIFLSKEEGRAIGVNRPLADATMRRIARGVMRYVAGAPRFGMVSAFLSSYYGAKSANDPRGTGLGNPIPTQPTENRHALVASHLMKLRGTCRDGQTLDGPMATVSAQGTHLSEVRAFLMSYYGVDQDPRLTKPMPTVTSKHRLALVMVQGHPYVIADIGMRMLSPRELFRAQGFPTEYIIDRGRSVQTGRWTSLTKTAQVRMCGNSVSPPVAEAVVRAQFGKRAGRVAAA